MSGDARALGRGGVAICDFAPQDVAMLVELEHESCGSGEAAQVLHALDREREHDAFPSLDAHVLPFSTSTLILASIGSLPA